MSTSWKLQRRIIRATQKDIAAVSRLSVRAVRAIERGSRAPNIIEKNQLVAGFSRLQRKYASGRGGKGPQRQR